MPDPIVLYGTRSDGSTAPVQIDSSGRVRINGLGEKGDKGDPGENGSPGLKGDQGERGGTARTVLTNGLSLYVNGATGSDSNSGLSTTTAFQTIQAAVDKAYKDYDTQGNNITINVATGSTYTRPVSVYGLLAGVGTLVITGTGGAAIISTTAAHAFTIGYSARVVLSSFDIRTTTSGNGIQANSGAFIQLGSGMIYGACAGAHMESTNGADILIGSSYTINGSAVSHWHAPGGAINANGIAITLSGTPNFSAYFLGISTAGVIQAISGTTFTGSATGTRYLVHHCGILRMDANVDIKTFIPGSLAGAVIRGGVANGQVGTTAQNGDGSLAQGNARGSEAVDWQVSRYGSTFVASGTGSVVGGGLSNGCSGAYGTVAGGVVNIVDSNISWVPGGQGALTRGVIGRGAWCSGSFVTNGDAQSGEYVLRVATSNATQTTLTTDGSGTASSVNQVFLPSNAVYMATILVSTRQTGGSVGTVNDAAVWDLNVYVKRGVAASTVVVVGGGGSSIAPTYSDAAAAGWRLAVVADTTNGALSIRGTGEANKNIRWVARVISVETT